MYLEYEEQDENLRFRHWLTHHQLKQNDDLFFIMDVNQWTGEQFGELGVKWGFHKELTIHNNGLSFSWRFKFKDDAMLFKLKWA
jgi:hypothetical protein